MKKEPRVPEWCVYLLSSETESSEKVRTYIGSTSSIQRRVKQHNGELRGGARFTRGTKWSLVCSLKGFKNRGHAMQFEIFIKVRASGMVARRAVFLGLIDKTLITNLDVKGLTYHEGA